MEDPELSRPTDALIEAIRAAREEVRTIDAALTAFWLERARQAPSAADLARFLAAGGGP